MKIFRMLPGAVLVAAMHLAVAQDYPSRTIRVVVPHATGSESDLIAHLVAHNLAEQVKQPVVVDSKPDAGGVSGPGLVAGSPPDGYTLLLGDESTLAIAGAMNPKLPFHLPDFEPVSVLATVPSVLVVNRSLQANNLSEFVSLARAKPGGFNFGSPGAGTPMHLAAGLFSAQAGIKSAQVVYKGAASAVAGLLDGQVQFMFQKVPAVLPYIRSGRLHALAVAAPARIDALPAVATLSEAGIRDADPVAWFAVVAPKGTPAAIASLLQGEINKAWLKPGVRQRLEALGVDPVASLPAEAGTFMQAESRKWEKAVSAAGLRGGN